MDLATVARIHAGLDELATTPRRPRAQATALRQLIVAAPDYRGRPRPGWRRP